MCKDMPRIRQILPSYRRRTKLGKIETQINELSRVIPVLEQLGGYFPTLDALGPYLATFDALGPRLALIDQLSHNFNAFNNDLQQVVNRLSSFSEFTELIEKIGPIVRQYLNDNHSISESVRLDVEALSVHLIALQLQIDRLTNPS